MTTLIVGASGATGKQLVEQLLNKGQSLKLIVRSLEKIPQSWKNNDKVTLIQASILDIGKDELAKYTIDCQSIALCLGHNLNFKGIYGEP